MLRIKILIILSFLLLSACFPEKREETKPVGEKSTETRIKVPSNIKRFIKNTESFFNKLGEPEEGEWLTSFSENGQTFEEFINSDPTLPGEKQQTIYIQPIGEFNSKQLKTMVLTADYLSRFYNLPTKLLTRKNFKKPLSLANKRTNQYFGNEQVRTGYILDELLKPNLPEDAAALICFTNIDLYPDKNYNFVFGQASLIDRVGVWSFHRLQKNADFQLFLKRVLKIATHETGHMFSFRHCTTYACAMNGSNHIVESDKRPLDFCPEDSAKIIWMTKSDIKKRYESLADFSMKNGLTVEAKFFQEKAKANS